MARIFSVIILLVLVVIAVFMYTVNTADTKAQKLFLPKDSEKKEDLAKNNDPKKWLTLLLTENNEIFYYRGKFDNDVAINKTDYGAVREVLLNMKKELGDGMLVIIKTGGASYKNTVDILDEMAIGDIKKYALVDIMEQEEKRINIQKSRPVK
jgi:biopolymer transport protein ExbD